MFDNEDEWAMEGVDNYSQFTETYQCLCASQIENENIRSSVEHGNKILMPTSALDRLSRLNIMYPMMFKVWNEVEDKFTYCGVLEFSSAEGTVYLPPWSLDLHSGELVNISNCNLPLGTYVKIQPQSIDFLDITDPRAVLEHSLRNFATLCMDDIISIEYCDHIYEFLVMQVKPDTGCRGISVLETDLQVEFEAPLGYKEPERAMPANDDSKFITPISRSVDSVKFSAFSGASNRLASPKQSSNATSNPVPITKDLEQDGPQAISLPKGSLFFSKPTTKETTTNNEMAKGEKSPSSTSFKAFSGKGNKLT